MGPTGLYTDLEGECDDEGEDCVGPAGLVVHVGGGDRPGLVPLHHQFVDLLNKYMELWDRI